MNPSIVGATSAALQDSVRRASKDYLQEPFRWRGVRLSEPIPTSAHYQGLGGALRPAALPGLGGPSTIPALSPGYLQDCSSMPPRHRNHAGASILAFRPDTNIAGYDWEAR
ncbi:hypothetical protein E2C01_068011 [Portunus trituberculatus]|uniref:Uncharacterized protein n=1 Tax=Portunus trituberculatus TaxID=210409 RepID=A0A5B7HVE9_PORTR|nr:hypothetical protein [Portunus trituberculatus]